MSTGASRIEILAVALDVGRKGSCVAPSKRRTGGVGPRYRFERLEGKATCVAEDLTMGIAPCMLAVRLGVTPQFGQSAVYVERGWKRYDRTNG